MSMVVAPHDWKEEELVLNGLSREDVGSTL